MSPAETGAAVARRLLAEVRSDRAVLARRSAEIRRLSEAPPDDGLDVAALERHQVGAPQRPGEAEEEEGAVPHADVRCGSEVGGVGLVRCGSSRVGLPYGSHPETCPVRAYQAWVDQCGIESGHVFRTSTDGGVSPPAGSPIAPWRSSCSARPAPPGSTLTPSCRHSAAATAGVDERSIMAQSGHRSIVVMRGYIRSGSLFRENVAARIGL